MTMPVYAYRKTQFSARPKRKNDDPEYRFQVQVTTYLKFALPEDYWWTANAAGVRVSMQTAKKMKAAGVRRGWPDLQFMSPRGGVRFIELKAGTALSHEQEQFRDACLATGRDIWALCRTLEEVRDTLERWKVPLRCKLEHANRYHTGFITEAD